MAIIENWTVVPGPRVFGEIYGDARFADGEVVTTSRIEFIDEEARIVKTANTLYELGKKNDQSYY